MSENKYALIHHDSTYAVWSLDDKRPYTTGSNRKDAIEVLMTKGVDKKTAGSMAKAAKEWGSSVPHPNNDSRYMSASQLMEGNRAGAFLEEVGLEQLFRHILIERKSYD